MQVRYSEQAVVLGGSMAGMLAGRVLSQYFGRVVIIERDEYPETPVPRDGVPQARHLHALLTRGHRIVESLFPGITDDWRSAGAEVLDIGRDFAWRTPAGWGVRFKSGLESLAASRALIDHVVRLRLAEFPNVETRTDTTVLSLISAPGGRRITGVRIRTGDGLAETIPATLVVDASGRMSNAPNWLKQLGYDEPKETVLDARLGYASRVYRRRPEQQRDWRAVFIQAAPPAQPRAGVAFPVEGNRWVVTLCGGGGDFAPTNEQGFLEFAKSLPSGEIYNLIRDAEPLGAITGYRRTENRWRHYERLARQPEQFVVIGDSACAFNPVYGQGMTTAALQAEELERWVRDGAISSAQFQKALAKIIATPWALATAEDMRYEGTTVKPGLRQRMLQAYVHRVMAASTYDRDARRALLEVFTMVSGPERVLRPDVIGRVLASSFNKHISKIGDQPILPEDAVYPSRRAMAGSMRVAR